jgi:hypothetical protein
VWIEGRGIGVLVGKPERNRTIKNPCLKGSIILKRIFWKWDVQH